MQLSSRLWWIAMFTSVMLAMTTMVSLFAEYHWAADLLANLRMQQCLGLLGVLLVCLAYRRLVWIALMLVCLALHLPWFVAAFPKKIATQRNAEHLTITLANVLTKNQRHQDVAADVLSRDPDIFVIIELSSSLAAVVDRKVSSTYPYSIVRPQDDGNFGIGLYSRHQIEDADVFTLNAEIKSIGATIRIRNRSYRVIATHPLPPMGNRGYRLRNEHLTQLAAEIRKTQLQSPSLPLILMGDLNLTPWSPHFVALENAGGLSRAINRFNMTPTWYRFPGFPFGLVLDHAMINDQLYCIHHDVGPDIGSDHRSVTVTLAAVDPLARRS